MRDTSTEDALGALLRLGDPAGGDPGLSAAEQASMRRRVLAARGEQRRPYGWLMPATTVVALLALALGVAWRGSTSGPASAARRAARAELAAGAASPGPPAAAGSQVQFTTEQGTLVVWVLQPRSSS